MTALARHFDRLATIEASFHVDGPWCASFELDGCHVRCTLDSDDWLQLSAPLTCIEKDAIWRQSHLLLPIKIVAGPRLVAEMPVTETLISTFVTLRDALRLGLAEWALPREESSPGGQTDTDVPARLHAVLEETAFTWDRTDEHPSTKAGTATVIARMSGTTVVFRADVADVAASANPSLDALTHFVLALNARFRFVRGTFLSGRLVQEVALPADVLTPMLANRAVSAIRDSCRMTEKACAVLVDSHVAEKYLEFHRQRKDVHADTHH